MPASAMDALSDRVVVVPEGTPRRDLEARINGSGATHAAVVRGTQLVEVVALADLPGDARALTAREVPAGGAASGIHEEMPLDEVGRRLVASGEQALPVVDGAGAFRGVVTPHSLLAALLADRGPASPPELAGFELANDVRRANRILQAEIWERIKAEAALRRSETLLRSVFDNVPAFITRLNLEGRITFVNRTYPSLTQADVLGRHAAEMVSPERREEAERLLATVLASGVAQSGEFSGPGPSGVERTFVCCVAPVREGDQVVGLISVATDITEKKEAEERAHELQMELAHVSRLSTMGEMASGMAHELNQPLAAIIAYADACQELVESGRMDATQLLEVLRAIASQAERAGKIIQRLRILVRKGRPVRAPVLVNDAIREVVALLESEARHRGVNLRLELDPGLPATAADFIQIQQVLLNLIRNGLDAMNSCRGEGCELEVASRRLPDDQLQVTVRDCGQGVAQDHVPRLFEPFFTTKAEGLGMGLSISRTIIEAHGGRLWLTPNADVGMTAQFVLPGLTESVSHVEQADGVHRR